MFLGHFGLAFAARKASPPISLGALFLACQFADLLWPTLVLAGIERVEIEPGATAFTPLDFVRYPYSHSLVALILWAVIVGTIYMMATRAPAAAAVTLGLLVLSHWALDYITHRPDMPLTMGGPQRVGLGLWNSVPGTLATESAIFGAGIVLYLRSTAARDRIASIGLWSMVAFLLVVYLTSSFGPPPPSPTAVAWSVQAMWLVVLWAYWVDRHRTPAARRLQPSV